MNSLNMVFKSKAGFQMIKEELIYAMCSHITSTERIRIFSLLTKRLNDKKINLYSGDRLDIPGLNNKGPVDYYNAMPYVFKTSKINLNISLKCISSGIPLRVVDVLGCGGFLLSNYQPEVVEYLEPGKEVAIYSSIEEAVNLVDYYLRHEEERVRIAKAGYEKIKKEFTYRDRLDKIFSISGVSF